MDQGRIQPTDGAAGTSPQHLSGALHVCGQSRFVVDEPRPAGMLFAKLLASPYAKARIISIDIEKATKLPGVAAVLTHRDVPGQNQIGHAVKDEPLFPAEETAFAGQPVALVAAESEAIAAAAVRLIGVKYQELEPVLSIQKALEKDLLYAPERRIERGDVDQALAKADHVIEGTVISGGQEHFYLETQACRAVPGEDDEIVLYAATQSTAEVQEVVAQVLGCSAKDITVDVKRLGGAFGGKERAATIWACLAALACRKTGRPVELRLDRIEDMAWTGKRHPYESRYQAGFTRDGKLTAYAVELNANGGAYTDLSMAILERSMLHADNAYHIPNARVVGRACRTNLPPNTAFRGFGAPQGILVIERVMERIARITGRDPVEVRKLNSYRDGEPTPYGQPVDEACHPELFDRLQRNAQYDRLRGEVAGFNASHRTLKRGIGVVPVKFGISFTTAFLNQASALLWVYTDGTVSLSHGGVEMGQEVNTKVAQVAATELGISLDRIRVESANTKRVGNASPTAASTGSDLNGSAAREAAGQIRLRLAPVAARMLKERHGIKVPEDRLVFANDRVCDPRHPDKPITFAQLVHEAYVNRVGLGAHGYYATPGVHFDRAAGQGHPFHYFVFGCALALMEVDLVSGHARPVAVHIVHETASSLNPEIDRGQIAGAFIQGYGWATFEEVVHDAKGRYLAVTPSTYKIPTIRDLPETFAIEMVERPRKCSSVFGSKGIGEPPLIYGEAAWFGIKDALESLSDHKAEADLAFPATPEAVVLAAEKLKG
ncbi:MAG: xanthine dehydrogenase molybdopterin binding subunit [Candidatus Edwardsbacteria bacterium]|jgi:xanthine dehydrogenase large subunit|nr:xanthine dehydrogenase molybdopterin binding subunit [Candidatus Edwardsbacteria bacterium]